MSIISPLIVGITFRLKLIILIFWTKFTKKGISGRKLEHHHLILNIEISLESVTKIVRLTPLAPLFNVENKFTCLFMTSTAWHIIFKLGTKLSREKEGILGIFEYII